MKWLLSILAVVGVTFALTSCSAFWMSKNIENEKGEKAQIVMREARFSKTSLTLYITNKKGDAIAESKPVKVTKHLEDFELLSFKEKRVVVQLESKDGSKSKVEIEASMPKLSSSQIPKP